MRPQSERKDPRPLVAVTLGDPAGIGPEIALRCLIRPDLYASCRPVLIGARAIVEHTLRLLNARPEVNVVRAPDEGRFVSGTVDLIDLGNLDPGDFEYGTVNAACGQAFVDYIRCSARLALDGRVDAVASAPTNKESMHAAGHHYSGQTDIYAEMAGTSDYCTILTGGKLRVCLVSSHVSLSEAIRLITPERMERVLRTARNSLAELWGIHDPKLGVAGLNPHAGDGGLFGREELEVVKPVIERLRGEGFCLDGPISADALYHQAEQGRYDGVVGMYHDQGVIPLKRYGYVTVIAGTPILRTTAGHGTAYDIAGKGLADESVMLRAILTAAELASLRAALTRKHQPPHRGVDSGEATEGGPQGRAR